MLLILIIIICISFYLTTQWFEFQKVYNSFEDWKLAHKIEKTLYKTAAKVQKNKTPLSININELTKDRQIDKICVAGPYSQDLNNIVGVNWGKSKVWEYRIANNDGLFSVFLIYANNVIPIKIKRIKIINYIRDNNDYDEKAQIKISINKTKHILINDPCMNINKDTAFELIENNSEVHLKILN